MQAQAAPANGVEGSAEVRAEGVQAEQTMTVDLALGLLPFDDDEGTAPSA